MNESLKGYDPRNESVAKTEVGLDKTPAENDGEEKGRLDAAENKTKAGYDVPDTMPKMNLEPATGSIQSLADEASKARLSAVRDSIKAQGDLEQYHDSQRVVMENRESEKIRADLKETKEQIQALTGESTKAKTSLEKASVWSYRYKANLEQKQIDITKKLKELEERETEFEALIPDVNRAEGIVGLGDEGDMIRKANTAKSEVERHRKIIANG